MTVVLFHGFLLFFVFSVAVTKCSSLFTVVIFCMKMVMTLSRWLTFLLP